MDTSDSEDYYESADEQLDDSDDLKSNRLLSAQDKKKKITNARPEYGILPAKAECWEPGMNYNKHTINTSVLNKKLGTKVKKNIYVENILQNDKIEAEPELECCEPNMNSNALNKSTPLPHERMCWLTPAMREKATAERKVEASEQPIDVESTVATCIDSENNECSISPQETMKSKPHVDECPEPEMFSGAAQNENEQCKSETIECILKDDGTNMWDNDEWSFNDNEECTSLKLNDEKDKTVCISKKINSEEPIIIDKKDCQVSKKVDCKETNILKQEENMWEDNDGWGFDDDSKEQSPIKQSKTTKREEDLGLKNVNKEMALKEIPSPEQSTNITAALDNLSIQNENISGWGSWGNWGISSVLSTAANITNTVSQGISNALEAGIGVPDPEELAREHKAEQEKQKQNTPELDTVQTDNNPLSFGYMGNIVSGVSTITKLVETTGTKVISGGLDTLETIGKKTMEVLQENDPNFKKKYAFLKMEQDKPVLSQLLREAKEKAEQENVERDRKHYKKKANYETIFDDYQGLVHLEALEMLSKQSDIKLQSVMNKCTSQSLTDFQETMDQVKELCELPDDDDEESLDTSEIKEKIESAVEDIKVPISYSKLLNRWDSMEKWIEEVDADSINENEIHQYAIETLAELTAISVELFHKTGELLLIKEHRSTADEADSLVQLTCSMASMLGTSATKFSETLNTKASSQGNKEEINSLITNVFLEAANSSRYIQDAFQLLIPLLQVGAV